MSLFQQVSEASRPKRWTLHFETSSGLRSIISRDSLTHLLDLLDDLDKIVTITKNF